MTDIGNTLSGIGVARIDPESVVSGMISDLTGSRAFKCYANVERPLYEKVLCQIPILVLDKDNRPVSDQELVRVW